MPAVAVAPDGHPLAVDEVKVLDKVPLTSNIRLQPIPSSTFYYHPKIILIMIQLGFHNVPIEIGQLFLVAML